MQRLGKNTGGYFGEMIDIRSLLGEANLVAQQQGWRAAIFHTEGGIDLPAFRRPASTTVGRTFRIYISTGIHGDEPAGPLAVLRLLRENQWPAEADLTLMPCLNPVGFANNTRENGQRIDLNRDYLRPGSTEVRAHIAWLEQQTPFDLCLCLHEDWESHGFYVYELNPDQRASRAEAIIASVASVCPIDQSAFIEGREAHDGIIRPDIDPAFRPQWPEAFWLLHHKTRLSYTLEAPSDFPLQTRVDALVAGVKAALAGDE